MCFASAPHARRGTGQSPHRCADASETCPRPRSAPGRQGSGGGAATGAQPSPAAAAFRARLGKGLKVALLNDQNAVSFRILDSLTRSEWCQTFKISNTGQKFDLELRGKQVRHRSPRPLVHPPGALAPTKSSKMLRLRLRLQFELEAQTFMLAQLNDMHGLSRAPSMRGDGAPSGFPVPPGGSQREPPTVTISTSPLQQQVRPAALPRLLPCRLVCFPRRGGEQHGVVAVSLLLARQAGASNSDVPGRSPTAATLPPGPPTSRVKSAPAHRPPLGPSPQPSPPQQSASPQKRSPSPPPTVVAGTPLTREQAEQQALWQQGPPARVSTQHSGVPRRESRELSRATTHHFGASATLGPGSVVSGVAAPPTNKKASRLVQRAFNFSVEIWSGPNESAFAYTKVGVARAGSGEPCAPVVRPRPGHELAGRAFGLRSRSQVVSVKNKYIMLNDTGLAIEYKQKGTPDLDQAYGEELRFSGELPHGERTAIHWDNAFLDKLLVIRPVGSDWCGEGHSACRSRALLGDRSGDNRAFLHMFSE